MDKQNQQTKQLDVSIQPKQLNKRDVQTQKLKDQGHAVQSV